MQQPTRLQRLRAWWNVVAELTLGVRAEADKAFKTSKTTAAGIMKDELHNFPAHWVSCTMPDGRRVLGT